MKIDLEKLKQENTQPPTADRPTWLVYFDYVISLDGDTVELDVEAEFENEVDFYIVTMKDENEREVGLDELHKGQEAEIRSEALATARAYGIFEENS